MKYGTALVAACAAAAGVSAAPTGKRNLFDILKGTTAAPQGKGFLDGKTSTTWWGQNNAKHSLSEVCNSGNFDVVYIAFVTSLDPPSLNLGTYSFGASDAQKKAGLGGLLDGTIKAEGGDSVANQIKGCQAKGVKIMVSLGGDQGKSSTAWKSSAAAKQGADYYWDLFLGGTGAVDSRPFGKDITLDGIDLDNETHQSGFYQDFISELRNKMNADKSRKYYISAAPEARDACSGQATPSIPPSAFPMIDWVSVQFYNDEVNGIGGSNFDACIKTWSAALGNTKLTLGMPGSQAAASGAHNSIKSGKDMSDVINHVKSMKLPNFAGISIWSSEYSIDNGNFDSTVKAAL